jgi:uncharacterized protein involved in type VI secretion and phage assembly
MYQNFKSGVPLMARAIVVANQDPDKMGRVKVTYPWMGSENSQVPSNWAFVCQPFASKEGGMVIIPEKGDEVVVFFEGGNMDTPIVIGTLYNSKAKPPASERSGDMNASGKNTLRYFKTKAGHLLCFDDSDEDSGIFIQDKQKRKIEIQSKKEAILISDENSNQIKISKGTIEVKTKDSTVLLEAEEVKVKAKGATLNLGDSSITAQLKKSKLVLDGSSAKIALGGNSVEATDSGITITGASSIKLGSGASEALIKGSSFLSLFNNHMHTTAMGPSGPPLIPLNSFMVLSNKVKTE